MFIVGVFENQTFYASALIASLFGNAFNTELVYRSSAFYVSNALKQKKNKTKIEEKIWKKINENTGQQKKETNN